jgi:Ser-tRNA(Ala) deacylase AlaX
MTEKLYWKDPYMREFTALVVSVEGNSVALDRTAFYPTGEASHAILGPLPVMASPTE